MTAGLFVGCRDNVPNRRLVAGSTRVPCAKCAHPTWFTPGTLARPEAQDPASRFVCIECADIGGLEIAEPTRAQKQELADNGHDANAWPLRELWGKTVPKRN